MRKALLACAIVTLALAPLRADVTMVQTTTIEGKAAAMLQPGQMPTITQRVKGIKARADVEAMGQTITSVTDLAAGQVIVLEPGSKVAHVFTPASVAAGGKPLTMPDIDLSLVPTGKFQTIDGQRCDEHAFKMRLSMAAMTAGSQLPPEAAETMKGVNMAMTGSMWIAKDAPGVKELLAFNKAALSSNLLGAIGGIQAGTANGIDKVLAAAASAPGVPYLTEITVTFEGEGPMVQMMSQMGPMKIVQRLKSISTAAIADGVFDLPQGYTLDEK